MYWGLKCEEGECPIVDDVRKIKEKLKEAEIVVFASPVYWNNTTPLMLNLVCRLTDILPNIKKKAIVVLVGELTGEEGKESRKLVKNWFKSVLSGVCGWDIEFYEFTARNPNEIKIQG